MAAMTIVDGVGVYGVCGVDWRDRGAGQGWLVAEFGLSCHWIAADDFFQGGGAKVMDGMRERMKEKMVGIIRWNTYHLRS